MAFTVNDRGTATNVAAASLASATFSANAQALMFEIIQAWANAGSSCTMSVSDTIADTNGSAWLETVTYRSSADTRKGISAWTRKVGSSPGATKTVTGAISPSTGFDFVHTTVEISGDRAAVCQIVTATGTASSLATTFTRAPAASSLVITAVIGFGPTALTPTVPASSSTLDTQNFDQDAYASAYYNGSSPTTITWTNLNTSDNIAVSVEIERPSIPFSYRNGARRIHIVR